MSPYGDMKYIGFADTSLYRELAIFVNLRVCCWRLDQNDIHDDTNSLKG